MSFEDGQPPPLYRDENVGGGKPRWRLCQGVGPAGSWSWMGRRAAPGGPWHRSAWASALTLPEQLRGPRELWEAVHEACAFAEAMHVESGDIPPRR